MAVKTLFTIKNYFQLNDGQVAFFFKKQNACKSTVVNLQA